jgi:beta-phosphoglucomutase-like phosphatase (HAD superfamily)
MRFDGIIFDFDGVLIESEHVSTLHISEVLTALGHPTSYADAHTQFVGVGGPAFVEAVGHWIGGPIPEAFFEARKAEDARVMDEGLDAVDGAVRFVETLPVGFPRAIASSSTSHWIRTHLAHLCLTGAFGDHIYSGREHVTRGKPAPDIYLHAAKALGIDITRAVILEDSPVGATGAVASGAFVIGLAAGRHCGDGHAALLLDKGVHAVAHSFEDVVALLS